MGKNKKKVGNVFKVAGAKSLKLKAKAKAVKSDLKQINIKNKNKVVEIDKALQQLESKMRVAEVPLPQKPSSSNAKLPSSVRTNSAETQNQTEETLKNLDDFQL